MDQFMCRFWLRMQRLAAHSNQLGEPENEHRFSGSNYNDGYIQLYPPKLASWPATMFIIENHFPQNTSHVKFLRLQNQSRTAEVLRISPPTACQMHACGTGCYTVRLGVLRTLPFFLSCHSVTALACKRVRATLLTQVISNLLRKSMPCKYPLHLMMPLLPVFLDLSQISKHLSSSWLLSLFGFSAEHSTSLLAALH